MIFDDRKAARRLSHRAALALFAEDAAGEDDRYAGAADDELLGVICAWDRVEAHASARKHHRNRNLSSRSGSGVGNWGLMTVKSRERCRSRVVTGRPGLLLRRMGGCGDRGGKRLRAW